MASIKMSTVPFGMNAIIAYHLLSFIIWIILHTLSLSRYNDFASWGLPDTSDCHFTGMTINNGIPLGTQTIAVAFADFVILLPLIIVATVGLVHQEFYGFVASILVFGINMYRTLMIFWLSLVSNSLVATETTQIAERTFLYINFVISIWGSWFLYNYHKGSHKRVRSGSS